MQLTTMRQHFLVMIAPFATLPALGEEVDFNDHIQPILSEYCYHCHGPDTGTREPKGEPLRLDIEADAFLPREVTGRPAIIKGKPDDSLILQRMLTDDPDDIMPPPEAHKVMKAEEIELVRKWIEQGAPYEKHWSFEPITRPEVPASSSGWSDHPIDRFAEAKLAEHDLEPNPDEDGARFYRRLHLDLTGLPPSPEDLATFEQKATKGFEEAIASESERLLATIESAEHFARHWLDAARYGDTHGIHLDNLRSIWPYRDWVIDAFHKNMRWDQFTIEQIAGDLLPNATLEQKIATGFHRCLPTTGEGGAIADEYYAIYAQDRVDTTNAVWMGLTSGCAACHDHKFDPISMKDNYSLTAFFRNTTMSALDGNLADHPPNILVPLVEDREKYHANETELARLDQALAERRTVAKADFEEWVKLPMNVDPGKAVSADLAFHLPLNSSDGPLIGHSPGERFEWPTEVERIDGLFGKAPVISNGPINLGDHAAFGGGDQVSFGGFIYIEGAVSGAIISRMDPAQGFKGWDLFLEGGNPAVHVIDRWTETATKINSEHKLNQGQWNHIMATYDGSKPANQRVELYINGMRSTATPVPNAVGEDITANAPLVLGSRAADQSALAGGKVALQDFRIYRETLGQEDVRKLSSLGQIAPIIATPRDQWDDEQLQKLFDYFIDQVDGPGRELVAKRDTLEDELSSIRERGAVTLIMDEKDEEPYAHILDRGIYSNKRERVTADTPEALPPMPEGAPKNRLGLAQWLMAPENPLTARVTMNRLWQQYFGTGIVDTVSDFGVMGSRPTHPKLLDWLASEFRDSGWDYRHMVQVIVTSRTYRQSSTVNSMKLEADPNNRLLSRGPRYRLDAEQIRDLALAGSGLLSKKVGGPPVKPYQPEGVWSSVAMTVSNTRFYERDTGEGLYRRSLYTFWKRMAPHPAMEILNAPSREVSCVARERTNTPLQAFVTLNDPQFVEASRHLAELALNEASTFEERVDFITLRLLARTLTDEERELAKNTLDDAKATFGSDPEAANKFISTGETQPDRAMNAVEVASWTLVASQIFNLDEALNK